VVKFRNGGFNGIPSSRQMIASSAWSARPNLFVIELVAAVCAVSDKFRVHQVE